MTVGVEALTRLQRGGGEQGGELDEGGAVVAVATGAVCPGRPPNDAHSHRMRMKEKTRHRKMIQATTAIDSALRGGADVPDDIEAARRAKWEA